MPTLLAGQESTASTTQNLALGVATNMRAAGILSLDQQAKLSQLEQDIQSGQRSLQFESVANLTGPDGGAANAKYMRGTDKALLNQLLVDGATSPEGNARLFAAQHEEVGEWLASNIGLQLDNGLGGRADMGATFGKIGFNQLMASMNAAKHSSFDFNINIDGQERNFSTDLPSLNYVERDVFSMERILRGDSDGSGAYQNRSYLGQTSSEWKKYVNPQQEALITEAVCECRKENFRVPSWTQLNMQAESLGETLSGKKDLTRERLDGPNQVNTRQACFNGFFMKSGSEWSGYEPIDPQLLPEVTYKKDSEGAMTVPILSQGRTDEFGNPQPASIKRAMNEGKQLGKGETVRWDMTVKEDPSQPLTWQNTRMLLEIKFSDDDFTDNQDRALLNKHVSNKVKRLDADDLWMNCENLDRDRQNQATRATNDVVKTLMFFLPLLGSKGGRNSGGLVPRSN